MAEPRRVRLGRTTVTIYGGHGGIGGNCVVVESPSRTVMLDQGLNFRRFRQFYGGLIQPVNAAELREIGALPPAEAYERVDEVYVSHLHLDHLGCLTPPRDVKVSVPSPEAFDILSRAWPYSWKQHLLPPSIRAYGLPRLRSGRGVRIARVPHSAYPAYAFRVDADDAIILYTGDFRATPLHPISKKAVEAFKRLLRGDRPDLLIVEGTNVGRRMNYLHPLEFRPLLARLLDSYAGRVIFVSAHPLDLEAALASAETLTEHGYTPVFANLYACRLLEALLDEAKYELQAELYYAPVIAAAGAPLQHFSTVYSVEELRDRRLAIYVPPIGIREIRAVLRQLRLEGGGLLHLTLLGEPAEEEWAFEERRIASWLRELGLTSYRIHVSGHYHPEEARHIAEAVKPKRVLALHTEASKAVEKLFEVTA